MLLSTKDTLVFDHVQKSYNDVRILKDINLSLELGNQYVIWGPSGSGKSTLLYLIGGLDSPTSGEIFYKGKRLSKFSENDLAQYRAEEIGFIFQFHFLLSSLNCIDNILMPAQIACQDKKGVKKFCLEMAESLGVSHCLTKYPHQLSGGEQQRINVVRALSLKPSVLLCDEPTGNLDRANGILVMDLITKVTKSIGATFILVTHDQSVAERFDRKITIEDGCIVS